MKPIVFSRVKTLTKSFLNIMNNSCPAIISSEVLLTYINLFPLNLLLLYKALKIAIKGVIHVPAAIKVPFPLYSIVPKTS